MMEKIDTDYKRRTWKILGKLFEMHKVLAYGFFCWRANGSICKFWPWKDVPH